MSAQCTKSQLTPKTLSAAATAARFVFFWVNCDNMGVRVASLNEEALPRPIFSPHFNEENERDYAEEGGPP